MASVSTDPPARAALTQREAPVHVPTRDPARRLADVVGTLPLLADLLHADLLLYVPEGADVTVHAHAQPHPLPSLYGSPQLGTHSGPGADGVRALFETGRARAGGNGLLVRGAPAVQEVFPIFEGGNLVAALSVETNVLEHERMRHKDPVLREALASIRQTALEGRLRGGARLGRIGEHDGLLVIDGEGQIRYISTVAENQYRRLGYPESLLESQISELDTNEYICFRAMEQVECLEQRIEEQDQIWIKRVVPLPSAPRRGWWGRLRRPPAGPAGALIAIQDITEEVHKEQELKIKSAMIREIHHRVKNNLQTIASLLRLQARRSDNEVAESLYLSVNRILSIAVVHEFMSHGETSVINIHEACYRILTELTQGVLDPQKNISLSLEGRNYYLAAQQATSCVLIVNELLQNAVDHGYMHRDEGTIQVTLRDTPDSMFIEVRDDGDGLPPGFDARRDCSLGLSIIETLVRDDLKGQFELLSDGGVTARIVIPSWQLREPPGHVRAEA